MVRGLREGLIRGVASTAIGTGVPVCLDLRQTQAEVPFAFTVSVYSWSDQAW